MKKKWLEIGQNIFFDNGFVFHESFVKAYINLNIIEMRRKLRKHHTHSVQDMIMSYIKYKQQSHEEIN